MKRRATFRGEHPDVAEGTEGEAWPMTRYGVSAWGFRPDGADYYVVCDETDLEFEEE